MRPARRRPSLVLAAALLVVAAAGCGDDKTTQPIVPPATDTSTPARALARFEAMYEQKNVAQYSSLFTADFVFHFSAQADPMLASQYGDSWGADDEAASAGHLFSGFTSSEPPFETYPAASNIALSLIGPLDQVDSLEHADAPAHYRRVVVPRIELQITVASTPDPIVYEIDSPHDLYLVRGDVALLSTGQPADSLHWYIRRWDDRSPAPSGAVLEPGNAGLQRVLPAKAVTWGSIKSQYIR
jgi:hypothetical protein